MISKEIIEWLTQQENPSVSYRTSVELLDRSRDDPKVQKLKFQINSSGSVEVLLGEMHPEGYWLQKNPRTGEILGDGVKYGSFGTTHYCLSYLAELGLDRSNRQVAKAAERYLNLQQSNGDFYGHFSCLLGCNIRTFVMLGYKDDPRVKKKHRFDAYKRKA